MKNRITAGSALFSVALAVLTAGCSLAPRYERPDAVDMPDRYIAGISSAETPEVSTGWWIEFGGSDLDSLVDAALLNSPTLQAAVSVVLDFRARAAGAGSGLWPSIALGGSASRSEMTLSQFGLPGSAEITQYSYSATTVYELDIWRRLADTRKAALASLSASEEDLRVVRRTLVADVVRAWIRVLELDEKHRLGARLLENQESSMRAIDDRYRTGLAASRELYAARQALAGAGTSQLGRKHDLATARRRLEILCGRYPAGSAGESSAALTDLPPLPSVPRSLPSDLLERRPDIRAAELRLFAAYASVGVARSAFFPSFTFSGEAGGRSAVFDMLLNDASSVWSLVGSVTMPLLNRGAARAGVESARAGVEAAEAGYEQALHLAFQEVENTLDLENTLREQRLLARESALAAGQAYNLSLERYRQGLEPMAAVLEAERRSVQAEIELITLESAYRVARVNLILALGGTWDTEIQEEKKD